MIFSGSEYLQQKPRFADPKRGFFASAYKTRRFRLSVCSGALIRGAAGLIAGKRATCHWAMRDHLAAFGAKPVEARVVFDGRVVAAGIDFALSLIAAIRGEEHARLAQLSLEYDPAPPFAAGSPTGAGAELVARHREMAERQSPGRDAAIRALAATLKRR